MKLILKYWRLVLEAVIMIVALFLTWLYVKDLGWPNTGLMVISIAWVVYYLLQLKLKLGLTLPFAFIITWLILSIMEWNDNQEVQSFDLRDYQLAIAFILHALNGAVIYFEQKMRW
ncbi:MAG: hypothetical protein ACI9JN_000474 [Bacteroidia bacterium]|jgi:hypothetical protein